MFKSIHTVLRSQRVYKELTNVTLKYLADDIPRSLLI